MRNLIWGLVGLSLLFPVAAFAGPSQTWVRTQNFLAEDLGYSSAVDSLGNVYVLGVRATSNAVNPNDDWVLIKYSPSGTLLWSRVIAGAAGKEDEPGSMVVDKSNNVWVVGSVVGAASVGREAVLYKYSPAGAVLFVKRHNGTRPAGEDRYSHIALDSAGNAIVAGETSSASTGIDALIQKYSPTGALLWTRTWTSAGAKRDAAEGLLVDPSNNVFVAGTTQTVATSESTDVVLWKLAGGTGAVSFVKTYTGVNTSDSVGMGALDPAGNPVLSVGEYSPNTLVSKFGLQKRNATTGNLIYGPNRFAAPAGYSVASGGFAADKQGNLYCLYNLQNFQIGQAYTVLAKYNNNGVKQWERTFKAAGKVVNAGSIAVDSKGNPIFLINETTLATNTVVNRLYKYTPAGAMTWNFEPKRPAPAKDTLYSITLQSDTVAILVGTGSPNATSQLSDIVTFKISGL
jgi:hypothetical protein